MFATDNSINFSDICSILFVMILPFMIQLLVCFKAKEFIYKLVPGVLCFISMVVFFFIACYVDSWDGLFLFLPLSALSLVFLIGCGLAWGVWALTRINKSK